MHFVLLAEHPADICPMSNSKTRDLMMEAGPQVAGIAERNGVRIVPGPYVTTSAPRSRSWKPIRPMGSTSSSSSPGSRSGTASVSCPR